MKTLILCGGDGIYLKEKQRTIPKALIYLDDKPVLWHVMKKYSLFGYNDFVLALGKYGDQIRDYLLNFNLYHSNISFTIGDPKNITFHNPVNENKWHITLVDTGEAAHTGARIFRCQEFLGEKPFHLAYSDCLSDVNLGSLVKYHNKSNKTVTVTGVMPPFRYGEFKLKNNKVVDYCPISKLSSHQGFVNGGFMVMENKIFNYLNSFNECTLESEVFDKLIKKNDLDIFRHDGFWQCLDNDREIAYLRKLCDDNKRFWFIYRKNSGLHLSFSGIAPSNPLLQHNKLQTGVRRV